MTMAFETLTKGCLMAALLVFAGGVHGQSTPLVRADIVGCAIAVDTLDDAMRAPMQSQCLTLAIALCEGPESGPAVTCFRDLSEALQTGATELEERLRVDTPRDASNTLCMARYSADVDRARCAVVAEFGHLRDLFNAARAAGVRLR